MNAAAPRYAVYWVPQPEHPLWQAGCAWLGRDPTRSQATSQPPVHARTAWRYGFHATLKAPIRLRDGVGADDLFRAAAALAAGMADFPMPPLQVAWLDRFLALRPVQALDPEHPLRRLADACVRELDEWRAPPTAQETARHTGSSLAPAQAALLAQWGYPHVLDAWRPHLTLSDPLAAPDPALAQAAQRHFSAALQAPLWARALAVFIQTEPQGVFRLVRRLPLAPL